MKNERRKMKSPPCLHKREEGRIKDGKTTSG
jgi:hypothetical protein